MKKIYTLLLLTFSLVTSAKTEGLGDDKMVTCPSATISYAENIYCTNVTSLQPVTLTGDVGGTFYSSPVGLAIDSATGDLNIAMTIPGIYAVTYTIPASGPCPAFSATTTVTVLAQATISPSSQNRTVCPNSALVPITFATSDAATAMAIGLPPGIIGQFDANTFTISGTPTVVGTFHYTVTTDAGGCQPAIASGTITVGGPTATVNNITMCQGSNATVVVTPAGPGSYTYIWTTPAGVSNPGNVASFSTSVPGTYSVIINDIMGGCSSSTASGTVTVIPTPVVMASSFSQTICSGNTTYIALTSNVPNTQFTWNVMQSGVAGASSGSGNTINQTLSATGISAGMATYVITPFVNGCYGAPITTTVTVQATPEYFGNQNTAICSGDNTSINLYSVNPATTYTWNVVQTGGVTGGTAGSSNNPLLINDQLNTMGNSPGMAVYTITPILNGCSGTPTTVTINVYPVEHPMIFDGTICTDSSGNILSAASLDSGLNPGTHTFEWYLDGVLTSATGNAYQATTPGIYDVTATNSYTGCISQATATVITAEIPQSMTVDQAEQGDGNYTLTANVVGSGTYTFQYLLDGTTIQLSNIFTDVPFGLHTVEAFEINGCGNFMVQLDLPEIIEQDLTASPNPVTDVLTLRNSQPITKITVFNQVGQTVFEQDYNSKSVQVDLSNLNAGIYFISMDAEKNERTKIIKN